MLRRCKINVSGRALDRVLTELSFPEMMILRIATNLYASEITKEGGWDILQESFGFLGLGFFFSRNGPLPLFPFFDLESGFFQNKFVIARIGLEFQL